MKITVTGASGHVGNVLCRLLEAEHEVTAFYRSDERALNGLKSNLVKGNVMEPSDLEKAFEGADVVIHCAAKISINGDKDGTVHATNVQGVQNVLDACIKQSVRKIIHLSSTHAVQENPRNETCTEDRAYKVEGDFAYDYSKACGEQVMLKAFREGKIEGCVLRPSSVVGPLDFKPSELGKALLDFKAEKIPILPPGGYNFVDVRDVCTGIINAIEKGRTGEIYFLTGTYYTIKEVAELVHDVTGAKVPKRVLPFWVLLIALPFVKLQGRMVKRAPQFTIDSISALKNGHPNISNEKAKKELNLPTRMLKETLTDFFNWKGNEHQDFGKFLPQ